MNRSLQNYDALIHTMMAQKRKDDVAQHPHDVCNVTRRCEHCLKNVSLGWDISDVKNAIRKGPKSNYK